MKQTFVFFTTILLAGFIFMNGSCKKDSTLDCSKYNSTYDSNMKAIINAKCLPSCHVAGGEAETSGIYTSYSSMKSSLSKTWEEINSARMPKAGSPQLTDAEKEAWECWKIAGYPEK